MKKKFSKILGVGLALALVLSLVVMAAPVAATHTSSATIAFADGASTVVGQASILDVTVTNTDSNDSITTVDIDFTLSDFTVTGAGTNPTGWTGSGPVANVVTYTSATGIAPGKSVIFSPAVTNPALPKPTAVNPKIKTTDAGSKAALPFSADTGWIGYIADDVGIGGNSIEIKYIDTAVLPLSVSVLGLTITVELADAAGIPTSTASEVAAAINDHTVAGALVNAAVATGKGTEVVPVMGAATLLGGTDAAVVAYYTATGILTVIAVPFEVWVDDDGSDANSGSEASPVATIDQGILIAPPGGTVNVLPGTYTLTGTGISISGNNKDGLTLESTGGAASTIIDASAVTSGAGIHISSDDVTVEGFTVKGKGAKEDVGYVDGIWIMSGYEGVTVKNNVFTNTKIAVVLQHNTTFPTYIVDGATVSGNIIEDSFAGIATEGCTKDCTISNNTITDCIGRGIGFTGGTLAKPTQGNTISGNTITGCGDRGIYVKSADAGRTYFDNNLIEGNTVSEGEFRGIEIATGLTVTDLVITRNDITFNVGDGIIIGSWGATNVISYNNILDNTELGINNTSSIRVDAENNWWGTTVGATIADLAPTLVDYTPWLLAPYAEPVAPVTTIDLVAGWNLISLPLIPEDPAILTVLDGVVVNKVAAYSPFQDWKGYDPDPLVPDDLAEMNDGWGYWVDMNTAGALTVSGYEVCRPQAVPPDYDLAVGWNLIGFKSTTSKLITSYLGPAIAGTGGTLEAIYGYNASTGVYFIPETNLEPGYGYWLAVNDTGTIYP